MMGLEVTVEQAATEEEAAAAAEVAEVAEAATHPDQAGRGNSRETTPATVEEPLVGEEAMTTEPLAGEKRARDDDQRPLPSGWVEAKDPRYNDTIYWYHAVTKQTSWSRPTGPDGAGAPPPPPPPLPLSRTPLAAPPPPPATGTAPERKSDHPRCDASPSFATVTMEDATRQMLAAGCKVELSTPLVTGSVKIFNPEKGYGFIGMDGGEDHFVHAAHLLDGNTLAVGARVVFVPAYDHQKGTGKPMATLVTGAYSGPNRPVRAAVEARNAARQLIGESGAHVETGAGRSTPSGEERPREKRERERAERRTREEVVRKRADAARMTPGMSHGMTSAAAAALCPGAAVRARLSLEGAMVRLTIRVDAASSARSSPPPRPSSGSELWLRGPDLGRGNMRFVVDAQHPAARHPPPIVVPADLGSDSAATAAAGATATTTAAAAATALAATPATASAPLSRSWVRARARSRSRGRERSRSRSRDRGRSRSRSASAERHRSGRGQGESRLQGERGRGLELARGKKHVTARVDLLPAQVSLFHAYGGATITSLKRAAGLTSVRVRGADSARPYAIMTGPSRDAVALAEKIVRALLRADGRRARGEAPLPVHWATVPAVGQFSACPPLQHRLATAVSPTSS